MSPVNQRILVICPWAKIPGHYWPCTIATANALDKMGTPVDIVAPGAPDNSQSVSGITVDRMRRTTVVSTWLTAHSLGRFQAMWLTLAASAQAVVSSRRYHAIHFISGQQVAVALITLLSPDIVVVNNLYGFPYAIDSISKGGVLGRASRGLREFLVRRAVATGRLWTVVETPQLRNAYQPIYGSRVVDIPYSLSPPELIIDRTAARELLNLSSKRFIFLIFGTHREGKDYATVIRALAKVDERAMVFFAGKLISDNDPHRYAQSLPPHRTAFLDGFVSERQMALCFLAADVVVVPYEEEFERGSGVLLEALRYDRPVLVSASKYLHAFVTQNRVGLAYRAGDADELANAMTEFMESGRTDSFEAAINLAAERHSWTYSVRSYVKLYGTPK